MGRDELPISRKSSIALYTFWFVGRVERRKCFNLMADSDIASGLEVGGGYVDPCVVLQQHTLRAGPKRLHVLPLAAIRRRPGGGGI